MKVLAVNPYTIEYFIGASRDEFVREVYPLLYFIHAKTREDIPCLYCSNADEVDYFRELDCSFKNNPEIGTSSSPNAIDFFNQVKEKPIWDIYFVVDRELTKLFVVEPDYPNSPFWDGNTPYKKTKPFEINHLSSILNKEMYGEDGKTPYILGEETRDVYSESTLSTKLRSYFLSNVNHENAYELLNELFSFFQRREIGYLQFCNLLVSCDFTIDETWLEMGLANKYIYSGFCGINKEDNDYFKYTPYQKKKKTTEK